MSGKPFVAVLGRDGRPIMPCTGKRARLLLERKRARVVRIEPFTIQLKDRSQENCEFQDMAVKIDPGSKFTGICVARIKSVGKIAVMRLIELQHRGDVIKRKLIIRAMFRRARRQRNTRYRQARFLNRKKPEGWLPPSLMHRVITTVNWVKRLIRRYPITELAIERVKFDMQKMQDPSIYGQKYQRGDLFEREVMEYLLERDHHQCVYCDTKIAMFEKDHVLARSRGGSNRISNLVLACHPCNQAKGAMLVSDFLKDDQDRLIKILARTRKPLKDAAAVNVTRNQLFIEMIKLGLPVEVGTGAQTKWNRSRLSIPKTHALDAACVAELIEIDHWKRPTLMVKCRGRGTYARTRTDKYGFPRLHASRSKTAFGFQTGDLVRVMRPKDKTPRVGRITIRQSGSFTIDFGAMLKTAMWKHCIKLQSADGYSYFLQSY